MIAISTGKAGRRAKGIALTRGDVRWDEARWVALRRPFAPLPPLGERAGDRGPRLTGVALRAAMRARGTAAARRGGPAGSKSGRAGYGWPAVPSPASVSRRRSTIPPAPA